MGESFSESREQKFHKEDAIRNASLSAMLFMLKRLDTCPMIGFDPKAVKKLLSINNEHEVAMMITIGKEKVESRKPRGYRKPVIEFVSYF